MRGAVFSCSRPVLSRFCTMAPGSNKAVPMDMTPHPKRRPSLARTSDADSEGERSGLESAGELKEILVAMRQENAQRHSEVTDKLEATNER